MLKDQRRPKLRLSVIKNPLDALMLQTL